MRTGKRSMRRKLRETDPLVDLIGWGLVVLTVWAMIFWGLN